eukprot:GEMP01052177.1.p1 GENE.GEMP01052177.1~~GEMP01052177.1.p1  ORF type:complete len:322 (+),score=49.81 GEMP01052177.1:273-1238(+)
MQANTMAKFLLAHRRKISKSSLTREVGICSYHRSSALTPHASLTNASTVLSVPLPRKLRLLTNRTSRSICAHGNLVAVMEESDEPFSLVPFDGIFGLSLPQMSEGAHFNVLDCFIREQALDKNVFSVFFGADDREESEITFGEWKPARMASDLFWVPVTTPGYWQVEMTDVAINNKKLNLCHGGCQVAVDSGTSLMAGPTDIINQLIEILNVANDCSNYHQLPHLGFVVGSHILNLEPTEYVDKGEDGCSVALMTLDIPPPKGPLFIFGDPFLRKFYTVYDREKLRVGFALAYHRGMNSSAANIIHSSADIKPHLRRRTPR